MQASAGRVEGQASGHQKQHVDGTQGSSVQAPWVQQCQAGGSKVGGDDKGHQGPPAVVQCVEGHHPPEGVQQHKGTRRQR